MATVDQPAARFWRAARLYGQRTLVGVMELRDRIYPEGRPITLKANADGPEVYGVVFGHFNDLEGGLLVQINDDDLAYFGNRRVRNLAGNVVQVEWDQVVGPTEPTP